MRRKHTLARKAHVHCFDMKVKNSGFSIERWKKRGHARKPKTFGRMTRLQVIYTDGGPWSLPRMKYIRHEL